MEITVDNVRSAGDLEVSKTTNGNAGETDKEFHFTVTLTNRTSLSGTYGGMTFTNGVAQFTLKNGESKTATNLPVGTTYTVVEAEADAGGYVTTVTSSGTVDGKTAKGTISSTKSTAAFENTKDTYGDIELTKTVSGTNPDEDKEFTFTVTIKKNGATDTSFNGTYGDATFTAGVAEITVKASDAAAKKIENLPNGTEYEIVESDYSGDGYAQGTVTGKLSGTIVGGVGTNSKVEITVDNEYAEGKLIVTKQLKKGSADFHAQKEESFEVGLYQKNESDEWVAVLKNGSAWTETITIEANGIASTVTFEPLDVGRDGKNYRVYELDDAGNKIESGGKYHEYTVTYDQAPEVLITRENKEGRTTVTNTLDETDVTFTKAWYGPASENALDWPTRRNAQGEEEYIPITVTLKRWIDADETESQGERQFDSFEAKFVGLTPNTTTLTAQTEEGTVTLTRTSDTTYTFNVTGLRASGTINGVQGDWEYRIIESQVDGYTTKYFKQTELGETELNGATSTVDNGIIHNTIIAASLPATGGMGTTTIYIAGASLLMLAVLGFIWLNRKRDDGTGI